MTTQRNSPWLTGFVARVSFNPEYASQYTCNGNSVLEMFYPDDEDVYEFIEFIEEFKQDVVSATVLMPDGKVIDAQSMSTFAEDP
jgi:hypothetical protein